MNITAPMQVLDYTIGRPIGRGNFSIVRQAKHRGLNAKVNRQILCLWLALAALLILFLVCRLQLKLLINRATKWTQKP